MNRYDIRNIKSQVITHYYRGTEPMPHQPEWGLLERLKWKDQCSAEEIADALDTAVVIVQPAIPAVTRVRYLVSINPDVWKWASDCTQEEIDNAISNETVEISPRIPAITRERCRLPQTYEVLVTDLTVEIAAENTRKIQIATLRVRLNDLDDLSDLTVAEVKECIRKLVKYFRLKKLID